MARGQDLGPELVRRQLPRLGSRRAVVVCQTKTADSVRQCDLGVQRLKLVCSVRATLCVQRLAVPEACVQCPQMMSTDCTGDAPASRRRAHEPEVDVATDNKNQLGLGFRN